MAQHTGIRLGGANLPNAQSPEASATACCDFCETRPDCKAWTYQVSGKTCWLTGAGKNEYQGQFCAASGGHCWNAGRHGVAEYGGNP